MTPRTVLITGCSTGIGRACAERLARAGHAVYATARRPESIEDLRAAGCRTLALDVTDEASMAAAVQAVEAEQGAVGALVNNAGYSQDERVRPGADGTARAARDAAGGLRPDREHELDGRQLHVPGRRRLHLLITQRRLLPDRVWDGFLGTQFPRPGA